MEYLFGFVVLLLCACAGPQIAKAKGRPWTQGLLLAVIAGPIGLVALAVLPASKDRRIETLAQLQAGQSAFGNVVELEGTNATDDDLEKLASNTDIVELRLGGTKITDVGLQHLRGLAKLQLLDVSLTDVTDKGLESLLQLPSITTLWLGGTKITDVGLQRLSVLESLKVVHAVNTNVTSTGVQKLKSAIPSCTVHS